MTTTAVTPPYPHFVGTDGAPIDSGYVWVGLPNLPPQTNPAAIYSDQDLTVPLAQPVRTSGGYPVSNGTPVQIYAAGSHSILVQDSRGVTVYYLAESGVAVPAADDTVTTDSIVDLAVTTEKIADGAVTDDKLAASLDLTGHAVSVDTQASGDSTSSVASTAMVQAAITARVASTTAAGISELATNSEATDGIDAARVITPASMRAGFNSSGLAPVYACRAWVNFNGTGTVAIRASGNVSSVTDNGTGDYTINFTTPMPHANYAAVGTCSDQSLRASSGVSPTTSSVRISTRDASGTAKDSEYISVVIFC